MAVVSDGSRRRTRRISRLKNLTERLAERQSSSNQASDASRRHHTVRTEMRRLSIDAITVSYNCARPSMSIDGHASASQSRDDVSANRKASESSGRRDVDTLTRATRVICTDPSRRRWSERPTPTTSTRGTGRLERRATMSSIPP